MPSIQNTYTCYGWRQCYVGKQMLSFPPTFRKYLKIIKRMNCFFGTFLIALLLCCTEYFRQLGLSWSPSWVGIMPSGGPLHSLLFVSQLLCSTLVVRICQGWVRSGQRACSYSHKSTDCFSLCQCLLGGMWSVSDNDLSVHAPSPAGQHIPSLTGLLFSPLTWRFPGASANRTSQKRQVYPDRSPFLID